MPSYTEPGDEKIGSIIGGNKETGRKLRERFLSSLPTLKHLKQRVERAAKKEYLRGLMVEKYM